MKHVALLIPTIDRIGGAERQVLLLAHEFSARGWQVSLIALTGSEPDTVRRLSDAGIAFLSLQMRKAWIDPRGWLRYIRWSAHARPDIVHAHLPHAHWFARWVRLLAPVRVVVDTLHTSNVQGKRRRYRWSEWLTDRVTCVSQSVADAAIAADFVSRHIATILPNGIVVPPQKHPQLAVPPQPASTFLWIALGRLAPVKDYPTLLRAFATLEGRPRLLIAGSGPDDLMLRKLAIDLDIEDRVRFAGFQQDVQPLLAAADAFVLSSLWEGLPVSVMEAQAAGLPIVVTSGAGTAEAMIPDRTGLLVPTANPEALSQAMSRIMAMSTEARESMGAAGRAFVEANFSLSGVADRWEALYDALLRTNPVSRRRGNRSDADQTRFRPEASAATANARSSSSETAGPQAIAAASATPEPRGPQK